jgi:hypothetical protein
MSEPPPIAEATAWTIHRVTITARRQSRPVTVAQNHLIGQVGKDREINAVFSKALGVLGHAEFFEPDRNRLHRGPARSRGAFNADVDLIAERRKVDRLGQKRLSTTLILSTIR